MGCVLPDNLITSCTARKIVLVQKQAIVDIWSLRRNGLNRDANERLSCFVVQITGQGASIYLFIQLSYLLVAAIVIATRLSQMLPEWLLAVMQKWRLPECVKYRITMLVSN